jgi:hypothetical protein
MLALIPPIFKTTIPNNINPTCPIELYTKKRLKTFSEKAPKIEIKILKKAIKIKSGCQIFFKKSKILQNNQKHRNKIVNLENIDKNVNVANGAPP